MIKLQGNPPFQWWEELQQSLYYLNIIFNSHIANIGVFLGKNQKYLQKNRLIIDFFKTTHYLYM